MLRCLASREKGPVFLAHLSRFASSACVVVASLSSPQAQRQAYQQLKDDRKAYWEQVKQLSKVYKPTEEWTVNT